MTKSIKAFIKANYEQDEIRDIATHGCVMGCAHGLVYYSETIAFHDKYRDEIWELVSQCAEDFGHMNNMVFISTLNGANIVQNEGQLKNLLAWFAVEHVCYQLTESN